jgi:putative polyhydroxyalkanoate system protein
MLFCILCLSIMGASSAAGDAAIVHDPMASISIDCDHTLPPARARAAATRLAAELQKRYQLECRWRGDDLLFERPGLSGHVHLAEHHIELRVTLGFLLSAMKPSIEQEILARLQLALRDDGGSSERV